LFEIDLVENHFKELEKLVLEFYDLHTAFEAIGAKSAQTHQEPNNCK